MNTHVECQAGFSACDHPMAVFWEGQRCEVLKILAEWRTPQAKCYRLLLKGGINLEAKFMEEKDWQIKML